MVDGDPERVFFEFEMSEEIDSSVELIVTKSYPREGVIIISIYFEETFFLTFTESEKNIVSLAVLFQI